MPRLNSLIIIFIDQIIMIVSFILAIWIRMDLSFRVMTYYYLFFSNLWIFIVSYTIAFKIARLDRTIFGMASINEALRVMIGVLLGAMLSFILATSIGFRNMPKSIYMIHLILLVLMLEFERFSFRIYNMLKTKTRNFGSDYARTLIVGAGAAGLMLLKEVTTNTIYRNHIIGFLDDDSNKQGKSISGVKVLGKIHDLPFIVNSNQIELIYVAMPSVSIQEQKEIIEACYRTGAKVQVLTSSKDMISTQGIKRSLREIGIEDLLGRESVLLDNDELKGFIEEKTVLVTGAAGSIGSELCRQIIRLDPKHLVMMDINENGLYDLQQEFNMAKASGTLGRQCEYIPLITSIRDRKAVDLLFSRYRPDIVFHAAAHKHVPLMEDMPLEAIKNNIFGTLNLLETAQKYGVKQFVTISTDKAVNPTNVMGATKRFVEKMVQSMSSDLTSTKFVAVRFGNVLGSNGSIIPLFKKQIAAGGPLTLTDKKIIRYFMTIPEAVSLVLQAATYGKGGEIFVLDMGEPVKILDLAEK
jgi:FlaA1/EpsC-like NDP-sugar epimerase